MYISTIYFSDNEEGESVLTEDPIKDIENTFAMHEPYPEVKIIGFEYKKVEDK